MDNQTNQIRAQEWAEIVVECNRSGQPKAIWCKEHGVNRKSFYYWQNKLRRQAAGLVPTTNSIVPLQITDGPKESSGQPLTLQAPKSIRIQVKGVEIELPATSTPEYIATLAKALVSE